MDVLSASANDNKIAWYENDGASDPSFTARTITTSADNAIYVYAADIDSDGDMDVLSASVNNNRIAWYENDGATVPSFTARTTNYPLMERMRYTPQMLITMAIWISSPHHNR